jgi:DNA-directed RNA polymerase specialized sigma24 family protein
VEGQPPRFVEWERNLRARLMAGDPRALAEAYEQFSPMVYGLAARVTGDRAAAEDVTQEVFLHL